MNQEYFTELSAWLTSLLVTRALHTFKPLTSLANAADKEVKT